MKQPAPPAKHVHPGQEDPDRRVFWGVVLVLALCIAGSVVLIGLGR